MRSLVLRRLRSEQIYRDERLVAKLRSLSIGRDSYFRLALDARWDGWFWIASLHDCVVGWGFRPQRRTFIGVFVDRDFRGLGVGGHIARAMAEWSRRTGIRIKAYPFEAVGAALYRAAGISYEIRTDPVTIAA